MLFGKRQERLPLQAKCRKGKPCGAICIPKGSSCREGKRTGDNEVTRYNQEYIASLFTQSVNPWTGQPDFQKFRSLPRVEQQKALKSAYRWLEDAKVEKKTRKDASAGADGKCGPGWKPAPGGKCVRTKRAAFKEGVKGYFFGAKGTERYNNRRAEGRGRLAAMGVRSGLSALGMTASTGIVGLQAAGAAGLIKPPRQQGGSQKSGADRYGDKPLSKGFKKKGITKEDLEKSRRKARIKNHPDRGGTPEEVARRTKKFQQTEAAYFRAARRSGIKLDSLLKAIRKIRRDQEKPSLQNRIIDGITNRALGKDFGDRVMQEARESIKKNPRSAMGIAMQEAKSGLRSKFVKGAGKCGPGWKPGPGGKCVRTKRSIAKKVAIGAGLLVAGAAGNKAYGDMASKRAARQEKADRIAKKVEQRAYDKKFSSRMEKDFNPNAADAWGQSAGYRAREKFERRSGVKTKQDSAIERFDGPRDKVDGKCGDGWKPGPGGKCIRSQKSGLGYGQVGKGAKGKAKWAAKRLLMASGDVEYNRRRSLGQDRKTAALHGFGSGLKSIVETAGTLGGGAIYRRSRDAGQSRGRALAKGLATGVGIAAARAGLTAAQIASLSRKNNKDSLMDDYYSEIAQIIEYSQGIRVDSIYGLEDQGSSLVGIASSGGDFFEFEIDSRSTGVAPRPDLTHSANERARGALSAMGISYRGDSAYEFLCGMEFREDNLGQSAKAAIGRVKSAVMGGVNRVKQAFGSKPATPAPASGGKRRMLKRAAKIGAGLAVAGGGVAAYKNRDKIKAAAPGISSAAQGAARDVGRSAKQAGRRALGAVGYMT